MKAAMRVVMQELVHTVERPWRIFNAFSPRRWQIFLGDLRARVVVPNDWLKGDTAPGTRRRAYVTFQEYLDHQVSSLALIDLSDYDKAFRPALRERLERHQIISRRGTSVLCLAARIGTEVKSFLDLGCFAVGMDLNDRARNPWVLYGDFHDIQFADQSIDLVYTNSLDHVYDVGRVIREVKRILKPGGIFVMEASVGEKHGANPGTYESFWWESPDQLAAIIEGHGFSHRLKDSFQIPWPGEMRVFTSSLEAAVPPAPRAGDRPSP
ncbi:MAG: class I SAM-dependent methyltransferase [Thermoanaerobaculia bacterium]